MGNKRAKYVLLGLTLAAVAGMFGTISMVQPLSIQATDSTGLWLGHVIVEVKDLDGNIKYYGQTDNVVTEEGRDCAIANLFETGDGGNCPSGAADISDKDFIWISLASNATDPVDTDTIAGYTGEVARETSTDPRAQTSTGGSETVTLVNTFTVTAGAGSAGGDGLGATETVGQTAIMDLASVGTATTNMFAVQNILPDGNLFAFNVGDTLTITWVITVTQA